MIIVYLVLRLTTLFERILGPNGLHILRKFFGIILLAIAISVPGVPGQKALGEEGDVLPALAQRRRLDRENILEYIQAYQSVSTLTIGELKTMFEHHTYQLQLECGGNGRAFFDPPASGNQWTYGAVACSEWTGVRLRDVLMAAGVQDGAVYTAHYGKDIHLSGATEKLPISRGVQICLATPQTSRSSQSPLSAT